MVANHQSFVDIPLILGYLDINIGFVAKKEIKKWYLLICGWIEPSVFFGQKQPKEALKSFNEAIQFIKNSKSVCVFLKGTRTYNGQVGEFQKVVF